MSVNFPHAIALMICGLLCSAISAQDNHFVVFGGGKHGYINQEGTVVIPISLDMTYVLGFSEGLAQFAEAVKPVPTRYPYSDKNGKLRFSREEKWGFIDTTGTATVAPRFDAAEDFSEGLAGVAFDTEQTSHSCTDCDLKQRWGFIDKQSNMVIQAVFHSVRPFSEGLAAVEGANGKWGYINKKGAWAIPPSFEVARSFHEGLAAAAIGEKAGYINRRGNFIVKPQFAIAGDFSDGLAAVRTGGKTGFAILGSAGGRWSFIGRDGRKRINLPKSVEQAEDFAEGRAVIQVRGQCGYIDSSGAIPIPITFSRCGTFSEGLADVFKNDKPQYIDRTGRVAIDVLYDGIHPFKNGLAAVEEGTGGPAQKFGYIDKVGKEVWKPQPAL